MRRVIIRTFFTTIAGVFLVVLPLSAQTPAQPVSCGTSICRKTEIPCRDEKECVQPAGVVICQDSFCFFDDDAKAAYDKAQVGTLGVDAELKVGKTPRLEISIPGLSFTEISKTLDSQGYLTVPYLPEYISAVYRYAMVAGSIVAVIIIIVSGVRIILSGVGEERQEGFQRIGKVIIGLAILWGSYALLYIVNPNLVTFKLLKIKYIEPIPLPDENDNIEDQEYPSTLEKPTWTYLTFDCALYKKGVYPAAGVVPADQLVTYTCEGINGEIITIKEMKDPVCKVGKLAAANGYSFNIITGGSFRDFTKQANGWCGKSAEQFPDPAVRKKWRAVPGFSNHGHGRAVDMSLVQNGKQLYQSKPKEQCNADPAMVELAAKFFYNADDKFNRLENEIWHFEYDTSNKNVGKYTGLPKTCNP